MAIGQACRERRFDGRNAVDPIRFAVASGHGVGKTTLVAWLIKWILDTRLDSRITVTAGTSQQLHVRTWPELQKWHDMSLTRDWFRILNLRIESGERPSQHFAVGMTCREENSENFAGQHNRTSTSAYFLDEASGVPAKIWEVAEGGLTDGEPMIFALGNPTRAEGGFYDCFYGKRAELWTRYHVDSRDVPRATNKELVAQWVRDFGEDSDFVKVRVRGEFPAASSMQLIERDLVYAAMHRHVADDDWHWAPKTLGVDVARYGSCESVIVRRQGLKSWMPIRKRKIDTMTLAGIVAQEIEAWSPDATFVDAVGQGAGVVDRLVQLGYDVFGVEEAAAPSKPEYLNLRSQMWGDLRDWLKAGGELPDDRDLEAQLCGPEYAFTAKGKLALERKEDMLARDVPSPDLGDAWALTFAYPVFKRSPADLIAQAARVQQEDYAVFAGVGKGGGYRPDKYRPWR